MTDRIRIAVLGASGYTGADLFRLALTHPRLEIKALAANAKAGQTMQAIWPHFASYKLPTLVKADEIDWSGTIGRAHVCTPVTNAHLVCRLLVAKKKNTQIISPIS